MATRSPSPRPRFEYTVAMPADEVLRRVRDAMQGAPGIVGLVLESGRIELTVPPGERHMWSPQLTVDVETNSGEASELRARFGPHPHVWTLYVALYAIASFAAIACLVTGASQWMLDREPWALSWTPAAVALRAWSRRVVRRRRTKWFVARDGSYRVHCATQSAGVRLSGTARIGVRSPGEQRCDVRLEAPRR